MRKIGPLACALLFCAVASLHASSFTVYAMTGSVRFRTQAGEQLQVGVNGTFGDGVTIRTYRDSSVSFTGDGHYYRVYSSSLVKVESEPSLLYGKISGSVDEQFVDLHFYYLPAPAQGKTMKVVVRSSTRAVEVRSFLSSESGGTRELTMYRIGQGTFRALTGFDCEAPPIRYMLRISASGDGAGYTRVIYPFYLRETPFPSGKVTLPPETAPLFEPSERKKQETRHLSEVLAHSDPRSLWEGTFSYPLEELEVISAFGKRRSYYLGGRRIIVRYHRGIDFRAVQGTPVFAPNNGVVSLARKRLSTGNTLVIDHGQGVFSLFFHLDSISVAEGAEVRTGDRIAEAGSTGIAAGPHLHWGVFVDGTYVDPEDWVKRSF